MSQAACKDCKFWSRIGETREGQCRKKAPQPAGLVLQPGMVGMTVAPIAKWAKTDESEWCGEWEEKSK